MSKTGSSIYATLYNLDLGIESSIFSFGSLFGDFVIKLAPNNIDLNRAV